MAATAEALLRPVLALAIKVRVEAIKSLSKPRAAPELIRIEA